MKLSNRFKCLMLFVSIHLLCMFCLSIAVGETEVDINDNNFPDSVFRAIVQGYDTDNNAKLSGSEVNLINRLDIPDKGITSLKGIEYLSGLKILDCAGNNLTSLDASGNPQLISLYCERNQLVALNVSNNHNLKYLCFTDNEISTIDVSNNLKLETLECNLNLLTSIDLCHNKELNVFECEGNLLTELDLSKNTKLTRLTFPSNNLKTIDISNNTDLTYIYGGQNMLTNLDVSNNTKLEHLNVSYNQISKIDVSMLPNLKVINVTRNQLMELDVSKIPNIERVLCPYNHLVELDVANNLQLMNLSCIGNQLRTIDLTHNPNLQIVYCTDNKLTSLDISNCPHLVKLVNRTQGVGNRWDGKDENGNRIILVADDNVKIYTEPGTNIEGKIEAYVTRCYEIILGRAPDADGLNNWINELNSGRKAAAEIIEQFVASAEFQNKNLSNADAVEILYKAMLGRGSDPSGKADWLAKLNAGQHITAVINGFCRSAEFKAICDSYGIQPGTVTVKDGTPVTLVADVEKIKAYVERCYQIILGRGADEGGLNTWMDELTSGRKAAAEIIEQFVASAEFQNKNLSNSDAVEILYKAMLGRGSDPAGKASWVEKLDAGQDLTAVINGFCGSAEFKTICDSYGIQPGTVTVKQPTAPAANDEKIRAFVARCYKIILGRDADEGGMNTWAGELSARRKAAAEIIEAFVSSQEFQNKKYSNADAVEILYKAMLGRGSDAAGKADWVSKLNNGQPLTAVINGFCGSGEFKAICDAYGITPGTVKVENVSKAAEETAETVATKTEKKGNLVEITNASDTVNENLGTAMQAIYINEEKAKEFIGRCYQAILGREAGAEELNGWIGQMMNGSKTADQIARGFLFSGEFKSRNIDNEELVKILYRVYMNREADAEGLATWTQKLDEGTSLNDLLDVFAKTGEFKAVVKNIAE